MVDEDAEALSACPTTGRAQFVHGHGLDLDVLIDAGIETADAVVVATDGDNTNIVIAQVAQTAVQTARAWSPACSTRPGRRSTRRRACDGVRRRRRRSTRPCDAICATPGRARRNGRAGMYILIVGGGKVGSEPDRDADEDGSRGDAARQRPRTATACSRSSSSTSPGSATRPSCSCSSGPASSAPTWWSRSPATTRTT